MIFFMRESTFRRKVASIAIQAMADEEDCRRMEDELTKLFCRLDDKTRESMNTPRLRDSCKVPYPNFRSIYSNKRILLLSYLVRERSSYDKNKDDTNKCAEGYESETKT